MFWLVCWLLMGEDIKKSQVGIQGSDYGICEGGYPKLS